MTSGKKMRIYGLLMLLSTGLAPFGVSAFGISFFGGKITETKICTCLYDPAMILTIDDLASGQSIKVKYSLFYSRLRSLYTLKKGAQVVGGANSNTICFKQSGYYCTSDGEADAGVDFIRGIGTSKGSSLSF